MKGKSTRKARKGTDELRAEYRRSDFKTLVRGKYYARVKKASNVAILDPELAEAFPNSAAVNKALHALVDAARKAPRRSSIRSARR